MLQAVEVESAILNVLLFLIIAVAGFGILAIFYMIVVEKTRDIGILKALGASSRGVMAIFLTYGLSLGVVGSGVGVILGLLFVRYINEIEKVLSWVTGRKVFDETIYYFRDIPTSVHPLMVFWVALGAMAIAVLASVLPARRSVPPQPRPGPEVRVSVKSALGRQLEQCGRKGRQSLHAMSSWNLIWSPAWNGSLPEARFSA